MRPETLGQWAYTLLQFNTTLQWLTVIIGAIGATYSIFAISDAARAYHLLHVGRINGLRQGLIKSHLVTHSAILAAQSLLTLISVMASTLPDIPVAMYMGTQAGPWVIFVIATRKLLRMTVCLILLAAAVYKVRWLRRLEAMRG